LDQKAITEDAAPLLLGAARDGRWVVGGVEARRLAWEFGTPLYVMDEARLRANCRAYTSALREYYPHEAQAIFASKALCCMATCRLAYDEGLGIDVVSAGEIQTALRAGVPAAALMLHGSNKTEEELALALEVGVGRIVADNFLELEMLDALTRERRRQAEVLLRLTPGIEPHTHKAITTGGVDSKFGFGIPDGTAREAVRRAADIAGIRLRGLHCHIGSQVMEVEPFALAAASMMDFAGWMVREAGVPLQELDLGGGLGIRYVPSDRPPAVGEYIKALADVVRARAGALGIPLPKLMVEPGRSIVGDGGATLYRIGVIKDLPGIRTYASVDGGMYENPRPALYQARYAAALAERLGEPATARVSIAGRCCESGDVLVWDAPLPPPRPGDLLVVFSTGAYNYSMAGNYNRYPRPPVVFVRDGAPRTVVERETVDDLLARDVPPA
jgi:diaminopimelate decarboxylase